MPTPTLTFNPITSATLSDAALILDPAAAVTDGGNVINAINIILLGGTTGSLGVISGGVLSASGTIGLITYQYTAAKRSLALRDNTTGQTALGSDFTTALRLVAYDRGVSPLGSVQGISVNIGKPVYLPATGHYYDYVSGGTGKIAANTSALARSFYGLAGYLTTFASLTEDDFVANQFNPSGGWIGGSSSVPSGGGLREWRWTTGPEANDIFWVGDGTGSSPAGQYANWITGEPGVDVAIDYSSTSPKRWNDCSPDYFSPGYFVEYSTASGVGDDGLSGTRSTFVVTVGHPPEIAALIQATTVVQVSLINGAVTNTIGVALSGVTVGPSNETHIQVSIDLGTNNAGKRRQARGFRLINGVERELIATRTQVGERYNFVFPKTVDGSSSVNLLLN